MNECMWKIAGMILTGENTKIFKENPVSVPLCPPQIPQGLAWN
jgi:hypothetical protein